MNISVSPDIYKVAPCYCGAYISCKVTNSEYSEELWNIINLETADITNRFKIDTVKSRYEIAGMRKLYRLLGKDPNRYRPSSEALCRRILNEKPLYQINTLVDLINLVSIKTGYSIGGFDEKKIVGDISFGVGKAGEDFEGIGRGKLNIEGLPVYRDANGGIGTPTSDEERTKIDLSTNQLLMVIHSATGNDNLDFAVNYSIELLEKYAGGTDFKTGTF